MTLHAYWIRSEKEAKEWLDAMKQFGFKNITMQVKGKYWLLKGYIDG